MPALRTSPVSHSVAFTLEHRRVGVCLGGGEAGLRPPPICSSILSFKTEGAWASVGQAGTHFGWHFGVRDASVQLRLESIHHREHNSPVVEGGERQRRGAQSVGKSCMCGPLLFICLSSLEENIKEGDDGHGIWYLH